MMSNKMLLTVIGIMFIVPQLAMGQSSNQTGKINKADKKDDKISFAQANPEDITNENFPDLVESFDYPNADIAEVVKAIGKLTGKNFILDNNVRGKITIIAPSQITVAEAYRAFLSALAMNGLTVVPSGKFLKIRQARAAQRDSVETYTGNYFPNTDQIITKIIKLKYINAAEVYKELRILNSKDGEAHAYSPTNSLIITDYGSHIERVTNILKHLDVSGFEEKLAVIRIRFAKSKELADLINQIINKGEGGSGRSVPRFRRSNKKGEGGSGSGSESFSLVVPDDRTNSIIVVGNSAGIAKIRKLVSQLDFRLRPEDSGKVNVYYVRHGEAEKIANVLNGIASDSKKSQGGTSSGSSNRRSGGDKGGPEASSSEAVFGGEVKVTADKDTNSLIITASKQDFLVVKNILSKIDIPRDQVFVKAIIMELNASTNFNYGINYYKFQADDEGNVIGRSGFRGTESLSGLGDPTGESGAILGFGEGDEVTLNVGGSDVTVPSLLALVTFLKGNVGANVLSTPQLMAIDNEESTIEVGQEVPVGRTQSTTGSTVSSSIERKKATIKMTITPFISPDTDSVRLKIDQQISQVTREQVQAEDLAGAGVVTNERAIQTTIVVDSGDTAVLGGLMSDQEDEKISKVPILGDIPILGWLFKSRSSTKVKRNLVVFITPKIIRDSQDNAEILDQKLDERLSFIQRAYKGRDPYGDQIENLPRKARAQSTSLPTPIENTIEGLDDEVPTQEEPAVESF